MPCPQHSPDLCRIEAELGTTSFPHSPGFCQHNRLYCFSSLSLGSTPIWIAPVSLLLLLLVAFPDSHCVELTKMLAHGYSAELFLVGSKTVSNDVFSLLLLPCGKAMSSSNITSVCLQTQEDCTLHIRKVKIMVLCSCFFCPPTPFPWGKFPASHRQMDFSSPDNTVHI